MTGEFWFLLDTFISLFSKRRHICLMIRKKRPWINTSSLPCPPHKVLRRHLLRWAQTLDLLSCELGPRKECSPREWEKGDKCLEGRSRGGVRKGTGNGAECGMLLKPYWFCWGPDNTPVSIRSVVWRDQRGLGTLGPDFKTGEGHLREPSDVAGQQPSLPLPPPPSSSLPASQGLLRGEVVQRKF